MEKWETQKDKLISEFESAKSTTLWTSLFLMLLFVGLGFFLRTQSFSGYFVGFFKFFGNCSILFGIVFSFIVYKSDISQKNKEIDKLQRIKTKADFDKYILKAKMQKIAAKVLLKVLGHYF